jgi:predicted RNA-binding Zn-ribbon protein involved in translation (DUF1610 family)
MAETTRHVMAGEEWAGFLCANPACGLPLLLVEIRPEMLDSKGGVEIESRDTVHKVTCPFCGNESVYHLKQLQRFQVAKKEQLS